MQIYTEYRLTDGMIIVRDKVATRAQPKVADYLLFYAPDFPIAVVEAKDTNHAVGAGLQQAMDYAEILDVPFAYSSNGKGFVEHDFLSGYERNLSMGEFPSPEELWQRYCGVKGYVTEASKKEITASYYYEYGCNEPRYYQRIAINRTVEAVARGKNRILLVMATGTGKTYTAFQIVYRLREIGRAKKVLYLADRNILVDQTISGDFRPLNKVTTKIEHHHLDPAYEVYFSLYQQLIGENCEEYFREFSPEFFDLIIVDECHRGSAAADSAWRKILEYFDSAVQIGMTATPKETKEVSNIDYFGEPIYTYSLKQGIEDGFLAPYQVVRPKLNVDAYGWRPEEGEVDDQGLTIEDKLYEKQDFDRELVIDERTQEVAKRITKFLKETDRYAKTIVFCADIDHAERMRQALVNENADIVKNHPTYIMRITGDSNEGKAQLDTFIDPDEQYPTIATTSELLTTGVNCKTCRLIVLDNLFGEQGMTKFKQIIGRGTRIDEDYDKLYFTILDFRDATRLFADPNFDGEPTEIYEPELGEPQSGGSTLEPPDPSTIIEPPPQPGSGHAKYYVHGVEVNIVDERVEYYGQDGKLVTESFHDYTRGNILGEYATLDDFLAAWNSEERKQVIVDELESRGVFLEELRKESGQSQMSDFDLICHIAYDQKPLTRSERANNVKKRGYLYRYSGVAREVLEALLDKYATTNLNDLDDVNNLTLNEFREFGGPVKIIQAFGGKQEFIDAAQGLEDALYAA